MFRRRGLPPSLADAGAAFEAVLGEIEPAKAALTDAMPTTRLSGRSLPDALLEFEERLGRARGGMGAWRRPETEDAWDACDRGIAEALRRARHLREDPPDLGGFEGLIWAIEQLTSPLHPFESAAEWFRSLRVRRTRGSQPPVV